MCTRIFSCYGLAFEEEFKKFSMPEGPSIIILKELVQPFRGKRILKVEGNSKLDIQRMEGEKITDFKSWGKHFLICFENFTVRIHLMMFGSYRINERKEVAPRLRLIFRKEEINFYACSIKFIEGNIDEVYDWTSDVMNDTWDRKAVKKKLKQNPEELACDVLMNQDIFTGVGNIIKNEVLFRTRLHPENKIENIPPAKLNEMISEARNYSFDFLEWKKAFVLRKHWQAYVKKICPRCKIPFIKKYCGKTKRRTFFCTNCQVLYDNNKKMNHDQKIKIRRIPVVLPKKGSENKQKKKPRNIFIKGSSGKA